ncbi:MAG: alanine/glycine:cation symporter family protein [Deltaproteobacteria bacterium]|nr:alanine/glycine:cation symporter family protein [Deltaproteobacteria bacterium]
MKLASTRHLRFAVGGALALLLALGSAALGQDAAPAGAAAPAAEEATPKVGSATQPIRREPPLPQRNFSESIDAVFEPLVSAVASVFFWDPFAAIGLIDPVMKDEAGKPILDPVSGQPYTRSVPLVVVWLVFGAVFFTLFMGFINFRGFKHAIDLVRGKYDNPADKGEVSHFKALATALSATVGLGNIAGVAVAITAGGPGATFWMIVAGLLGMSSKFTECTLGVKYREIDEQGSVSGGAMYYLSRGLAKWGGAWKPTGKGLAILFAVLCVGGSFGGGNMFQANQAFKQVSTLFPGMSSWGVAFGMGVAILVGLVIIGGIQSIAKVTSVIVPFMCGMYVAVALVIIGMNLSHVGDAFGAIFAGAFSAKAMYGGFLGVIVQGFKRAAFSNEAGIGSASIAHSAAKTDEPISEGIVALLEPFIDTVVVCTMTALVIIFTDSYKVPGLEGTALTSHAFGTVFTWFPYLLALAAFLFAFSTMISWSYYGLKAWNFLFGGNRYADLAYKILFLLCVVIGSASSLGAVLDFSDMMILGMAFPNILGLLLLSKEVRADLRDYLRRLKSGEIKKFA